MMSIESIRYEAVQAAERSRETGTRPECIMSLEDIEQMPPFPFPFVGNRAFDNHKRVDTYFVDTSSYDPDDASGPDLSINGFRNALRERFLKQPEASYAIVESSMFQVVVGVFIPTDD